MDLFLTQMEVIFVFREARQIQTPFLDYALHELSITGGYLSRMAGRIEWIQLHR